MAQQPSRRISRRAFIRYAALAGGASVAAACSPPVLQTAPQPTTAPAGAVSQPTTAPASAPAAAPATEKVLRLGVNVPPSSFNPLNSANAFEYWANSLSMAQLTYPDPEKNTVVPGLAESWTVTPDGTSVTFKLNPNAKWHDGRPVTANDVAFTYTMGLNSETGSNRVGAWSLIKGGADYNAGKATAVSGITVIDDHTVQFDMENPTGLFVNETAQRGHILPQHLLGEVAPANFAKNQFFIDSPLGSGPFKMVAYVPDQYAEFEANPDHWGGKPKIDRVVLNIIKSIDTMEVAVNNGDIMMGILDGSQYPIATFKKYAADPNFRVVATGGGPVLGYGFNFRKEGIADPRLHQAFLYALDRKQLLEKFLGGVGKTVNSFMVHLWYQKPEWADLYPYDPEKAKSLLQEMNWDSNRELTVNILPISNEDDRAYLAAQQQMLADVGIKIKFAELETSVWVEEFYNEPHKFELAYVTYGVFPDPDGFLYWHIHSTSKNAFGYASPEMDALIEAGRKAIAQEDRIPIYQEITEQVLKDVPVAAVHRQTFVWFYNPKWVVPGIASLPSIQPDFVDLGPGRYLFTDFDAWVLNPEQWDLTA